MIHVLLLNGPNLNLLGQREPDRYGHQGLAEIEQSLIRHADSLGVTLRCVQSNHEGALIDAVHAASGKTNYLIVNAGALTHTSIGLRDALLAVALPFIEVHLSNVYAREPFRHHSYLSDIAMGQIVGLGPIGYRLALDAIVARASAS